ncbi:hypothetical protein [Pseudonocardia dioxanivorans]|jgi:hypothetical protein|uniref:Uncharacterized protein n=2 Tax=Pseudonocardia TaxID=1847 RepID=F4CNT4_PSEUX|nr:hypothetical protein [Pseudonocardia dioxanivorans]AEA22546.1 hypothetical protein Psed_0271 [Pseudonocardia dioxanivorans CB1190]AEA27984.1 hypothetical protein Psed_5860 [Pseudonocardia dioxanivorans CB1190]GJF05877.1 hypothetical protein PSD17_48250 [Pseudonocardia sp. D17]
MFKSHCSTSKHHNDDYGKHCDDNWSDKHHNWDDKYSHCWDNGRYDDDYCDKSSYSDSHCHDSYDKGCHDNYDHSSSYGSHHAYN